MSDLVQRLRQHAEYGWHGSLVEREAADRIEEQDKAIANMVDCRTADYERIQSLEAALREIEPMGGFVGHVARSALET